MTEGDYREKHGFQHTICSVWGIFVLGQDCTSLPEQYVLFMHLCYHLYVRINPHAVIEINWRYWCSLCRRKRPKQRFRDEGRYRVDRASGVGVGNLE